MYVVASDKFLQSLLNVSPCSDSTDVLVSWFCDNSPQSVYKLVKSRSRANTVYGKLLKFYSTVVYRVTFIS